MVLRVLRRSFTGKNRFHWRVSLTWFHARVNAAKMVKRDQNSWRPDAGNVSGEGEMSQNAGMCIQTALCDGSGPRIYITVKRWLTECPQSSWRQWRKLFFVNKQDTWNLGRSDLKIGRNLLKKQATCNKSRVQLLKLLYKSNTKIRDWVRGSAMPWSVALVVLVPWRHMEM